MQSEGLEHSEFEATASADAVAVQHRLGGEGVAEHAVPTKRVKRRDRKKLRKTVTAPYLLGACVLAALTTYFLSSSFKSTSMALSQASQLEARRVEAGRLGILEEPDFDASLAGSMEGNAGPLLREGRLAFEHVKPRNLFNPAVQGSLPSVLTSSQKSYLASLDVLSQKTWFDASHPSLEAGIPIIQDLKYLRDGIDLKIRQAKHHLENGEQREALLALETASSLASLPKEGSDGYIWNSVLRDAVSKGCLQLMLDFPGNPVLSTELARIGASHFRQVDPESAFKRQIRFLLGLKNNPVISREQSRRFARIWPVKWDTTSFYDGVRADDATESVMLDYSIRVANVLDQAGLTFRQRKDRIYEFDQEYFDTTSRLSLFIQQYMSPMNDFEVKVMERNAVRRMTLFAIQRMLKAQLGEPLDTTIPIDPFTGREMHFVEWPEGDFALISTGTNGTIIDWFEGEKRPKDSISTPYRDDLIRYFKPLRSQGST
jgi:hypothetical protein